jgi:hypothetical protein
MLLDMQQLAWSVHLLTDPAEHDLCNDRHG